MLCDPGYSGLSIPTFKMCEVPWATGFQGWWILRIPWGLVESKFSHGREFALLTSFQDG